MRGFTAGLVDRPVDEAIAGCDRTRGGPCPYLACRSTAVSARYGVVSNLYKQFANSPTYLASITEHMGQVMGPGKIDETTKEVISFVVSAINGCDYCINAHKFGLQQQGLDDEAIAEILAVASLWEELTRFAIGSRLHWKA